MKRYRCEDPADSRDLMRGCFVILLNDGQCPLCPECARLVDAELRYQARRQRRAVADC